jgi:hypothetical protein
MIKEQRQYFKGYKLQKYNEKSKTYSELYSLSNFYINVRFDTTLKFCISSQNTSH